MREFRTSGSVGGRAGQPPGLPGGAAVAPGDEESAAQPALTIADSSGPVQPESFGMTGAGPVQPE
jgi:hypothetical protein